MRFHLHHVVLAGKTPNNAEVQVVYELWYQGLVFSLSAAIVSPDRSVRYYAFVVIMLLRLPLPEIFLCVLYTPRVPVQSFSNSGHLFLVPSSRCHLILGTLQFYLRPLGDQMPFSSVHFKRPEFSTHFLYSHTIRWNKLQMPINFQHPMLPVVATRQPISIVYCMHCEPQIFQLFFFKLASYFPHTKA